MLFDEPGFFRPFPKTLRTPNRKPHPCWLFGVVYGHQSKKTSQGFRLASDNDTPHTEPKFKGQVTAKNSHTNFSRGIGFIATAQRLVSKPINYET